MTRRLSIRTVHVLTAGGDTLLQAAGHDLFLHPTAYALPSPSTSTDDTANRREPDDFA